MRKIFGILLGLWTVSSLPALPIGNPAEPLLYITHALSGNFRPCWAYENIWCVRIGYTGNVVWNRYLQVKDSLASQTSSLLTSAFTAQGGFIACALGQVADLFATVGVAHFTLDTLEKTWGLPTPILTTLTSDSPLCWSAGGRLIVLQWGSVTLGLEGEYFCSTPRWMSFDNFYSQQRTSFPDSPAARYSEWQVGGGLAYTLTLCDPHCTCTPYIGVKGARVHLDSHHFPFHAPPETLVLTIYDLQAQKKWGVGIGATCVYRDCVGCTVEWRWGDENALYINGQISF